jgi:hypothetical protein
MARKMTAAVLLDLKDKFSSKIRGAGVSVQGFADKAAGAAEKANKAFSGTAGILGGLGVSIGALSAVVRDNATGELRDFNDILLDVADAYKDFRKADYINSIFGSETLRAIRAYGSEFAQNIPRMKDLGDTAGTLAGKSAVMADTLKSNLQNLQTAFYGFADKNLAGPLQGLTKLLDKLAENPEQIEAWMRSIARGIGIIAGVKISAGIVSFIANLKSLKGGTAPDLSGLANAGGGAGIPVQVTNWGGAASVPAGIGSPSISGSAGLPGIQTGGGLEDQYGNPLVTSAGKTMPPGSPASKWKLNKPNWKEAAASAGISAVITAGMTIPGMISELNTISKSEDLTDLEKGRAKGGAVGETIGAISGAAAGALAGAAIGSIVPVVGTALGAIVGGLIGQFGGPVGRAIGEKIGEAAAEKKAKQELLPQSPGIAPYNVPGLSGPGLVQINPAGAYPEAAPGLPGVSYTTADTANALTVTGMPLTPQGQFSTRPDDHILAAENRATISANTGITMVNNQYRNTWGVPGIVQYNTSTANTKTVNDMILTPQGQFSTHPDDYILAMKNPTALVSAALPGEIRNEVRSVERVSQAAPPVVVEGEIELRSELVIDDKGYRFRQSAGKNTTPYKFAVGSAKNARLIQ